MSISERVKAAEASLLKLRDDLTAAAKQLEEQPEDESVLATVEELTAMHDKQQKTLTALQNAERALMARALPAGASVVPGSGGSGNNDPPQSPAIIVRRQDPKNAGDVIFKHGVVAILSHCKRMHPDQVIEMYFKDLPYVKATWDYVRDLQGRAMQKTAVDPAMTTVTGWAAELVRTDIQGFMTSLQDVSIAAALAPFTMQLSFDGFNAITVPSRNKVANTATEPAWVGEGGVIPLTRFTLASSTINRYKLAAITTMTREIADRSTPSIQGVINDALREAYAVVLDAALLSTTAAVANVRPAGLRNVAAGAVTSAGAAGGGEDAVRADVMSMASGLATAGVGVKPVLIINNLDALGVSMMTSALSEPIFAAELASGRLLGMPVIKSAHIAQHIAVMVDANFLATAFDPPTFDVSDVATITEANADATPPTQADDGAGVVGTAGQVPVGGGIPVAGGGAGAAFVGYQARSLWQTYSLGIRMIAPTSWKLMQTGAVQIKTATTWTA
jgi:HK97 family phage major capsid protein